uniref:Adenine phosphoribosyltransferase n=1 Tax=Myxobolus squamalis TaxID=59785 RepID=A0A6B2G5V8_MYXSQ
MIENIESIKKTIRTFQDFPIKGVSFMDLMPILENPETMLMSIDVLVTMIKEKGWKFDYVAGLEARGFLFGVPVAMQLGCGFLPIRKKGKLPGPLIGTNSTKEYGDDFLEIQDQQILKGANVIIVDDLLATGGTVRSAISLLTKAGCNVTGAAFLVELSYLDGGENLEVDYFAPITFNSEN